MSNLIPTPIVDKHGKRTTVHKKAVTAATVRNTMPGPVLPPEPDKTRTPREEFKSLLSGDDNFESVMTDLDLILNMMDEDNAESIPLFIRLLTTGTESARARTRGGIKTDMIDIQEAFDAAKNGDTGSPVWKYDCMNSWHPASSDHALRAWNAMNVIEEVDNGINVNDVFYQIGDLEMLYSAVDPMFRNHPREDSFWRGTAALGMCGDVAYKDDDQHVKKFIDWAGNHDDIGMAVRVAVERDTLNVEVLEDIISRQDANSPIREGML
jgi:hypothetical protein